MERAFVLTNSRDIAHRLLLRVIEGDSYVNLLLPSLLRREQVPEAERGLIQELSYGALRWQLQYDAIIDNITSSRELTDRLRVALRLGLHQLFRMRIPPHAAIHETVELVKRVEPKAAGLANAVLRNAQRSGLEQLLDQLTDEIEARAELSIRHSHPEWIVHALEAALRLDGREEGLEDLLRANNETPEINLIALDQAASESLAAAGLAKGTASPRGFLLQGNPESYLSKSVRVQDQGSQIVAIALLELVGHQGDLLDMCSGPGGKSAVLQAGLESGSLTCMEPNAKRAELVRQALGPDSRSSILVAKGQEAEENRFDGVLLDAPCSGLGSLRRKPESRWRKQPDHLQGLLKTQEELIDAAVNSLRSGGVLLYSTCTPVISETNGQISAALDRHPGLELMALPVAIAAISPQLELNTARKSVQLWTHLHGTDAMFMAALRKK